MNIKQAVISLIRKWRKLQILETESIRPVEKFNGTELHFTGAITNEGGTVTEVETLTYYFKIIDSSDYSDPENPIYQITREDGTVKFNNSLFTVPADPTLRTPAEGKTYWHLKWTYTHTSDSSNINDPVSVIDTTPNHDEKLPTEADPNGEIWLTIGSIDRSSGELVIKNFITEVLKFLFYNDCALGFQVEQEA